MSSQGSVTLQRRRSAWMQTTGLQLRFQSHTIDCSMAKHSIVLCVCVYIDVSGTPLDAFVAIYLGG